MALFQSCEKTIDLDVKQTPPQVVIEGMVTDQPGMQFVKVSLTQGFYSDGATPRISDATVKVTDNEGQEVSFVHNPSQHTDSVGYYLPSVPFVGKVGNTYTLTVTANGENYTASDELLPVTTVDRLEVEINQDQFDEIQDTPDDEFDDPIEKERYYEVFVFAKEPQDPQRLLPFQVLSQWRSAPGC